MIPRKNAVGWDITGTGAWRRGRTADLVSTRAGGELEGGAGRGRVDSEDLLARGHDARLAVAELCFSVGRKGCSREAIANVGEGPREAVEPGTLLGGHLVGDAGLCAQVSKVAGAGPIEGCEGVPGLILSEERSHQTAMHVAPLVEGRHRPLEAMSDSRYFSTTRMPRR